MKSKKTIVISEENLVKKIKNIIIENYLGSELTTSEMIEDKPNARDEVNKFFKSLSNTEAYTKLINSLDNLEEVKHLLSRFIESIANDGKLDSTTSNRVKAMGAKILEIKEEKKDIK